MAKLTSVFISCAQEDTAFAQSLQEALRRSGIEARLPPRTAGAEASWTAKFHHAIDSARWFLFVLTPLSALSDICREELEYAWTAEKSMILVLHKKVTAGAIPTRLHQARPIDFEQEDFKKAMAELVHAIQRDQAVEEEDKTLEVKEEASEKVAEQQEKPPDLEQEVAEKKRTLPTLRETIAALGLKADPELDRVIPLAWQIQQRRSEKKASRVQPDSFVSRPSLFFAAATVNPTIWKALEESGLQRDRLLLLLGVGGFEKKPPGDRDDVPIHGLVEKALMLYKERCLDRPTVDSLALVYGLLAVRAGGRFEDSFKMAGGNFDAAETSLLSLMQRAPVSREARDRTPPKSCVHCDRWTDQDLLGYNLYADAIAKFIGHRESKPPLVIGVQAPWGQGKTSLMRMVQKRLDPEHPHFDQGKQATDQDFGPPSLTLRDVQTYLVLGEVPAETIKLKRPTVWFNAWKYQSSEEIWAGLAHSILSQLTSRLKKPIEREAFWLKLQLKRIDPKAVRSEIHRATLEEFLPKITKGAALAVGGVFILGIAVIVAGLTELFGTPQGFLTTLGSVLSGGSFFGGLWKSYKSWASAGKDALEKKLEGAYSRWVRQPDYTGRMGFLHLVEEDMRRVLDLLVDPEHPLVIFVDDLDRCSPTKVGEVVEAINLFLAGNYRGCVFVLGMDAQVVAASMEVVHHKIIEKLADRQGELGWCFMDKFVQLPFVIPRLAPSQRKSYIEHLLAQKEEPEALRAEVEQEAQDIETSLQTRRISADEAAGRIAKIAPEVVKSDPGRASEMGRLVIDVGGDQFSDDDPVMLAELEKYVTYLSDNPRTIKRVVNLYRFHRFISWGRPASGLDLRSAEPAEIARWVVVIIRWPHFVRWVQKHALRESPPEEDEKQKPPQKQKQKGKRKQKKKAGSAADEDGNLVSLVIDKAKTTNSVEDWGALLEETGIEHAGWGNDPDLWRFLREHVGSDKDLIDAAECGFW